MVRLSEALETVERLGAGAAAPKRLAGRGAEAAQFLGVVRRAARAGDRLTVERRVTLALRRRRDAVGGELGAALGGDPVGGPGRTEFGADRHGREARGVQRLADIA